MNKHYLLYKIEQTKGSIRYVREWFIDFAELYHGTKKPVPGYTITKEDIEADYRLWGWILRAWRGYLHVLVEVSQLDPVSGHNRLEGYKMALEFARGHMERPTQKKRDFTQMRIDELNRILEG